MISVERLFTLWGPCPVFSRLSIFHKPLPAGQAFAMMKRDRVIFALPRTTRQATLELSNDGHQAPTHASHNGALIRISWAQSHDLHVKIALYMARL